MISISSIKNFTIINGFLIFLSVIQYTAFTQFTITQLTDSPIDMPTASVTYIILLLRNYALVHFIDYSIQTKPLIHSTSLLHKDSEASELHRNLLITTALEAVTHLFILGMGILDWPSQAVNPSGDARRWIVDHEKDLTQTSRLLYFIPLSFLFEVVLDFFHYWAHRALHHKSVYAYVHKKHHHFHHPYSMTTFYHHPLDILFTISLPTVLSLLLIPAVSPFEFFLLTTYKIFSEISGHSGRKLAPTGSFPQCIWLPKQLSMELYTEDHDLHHSLNNCNYAKRFSLWDKVFGTFRVGT